MLQNASPGLSWMLLVLQTSSSVQFCHGSWMKLVGAPGSCDSSSCLSPFWHVAARLWHGPPLWHPSRHHSSWLTAVVKPQILKTTILQIWWYMSNMSRGNMVAIYCPYFRLKPISCGHSVIRFGISWIKSPHETCEAASLRRPIVGGGGHIFHGILP